MATSQRKVLTPLLAVLSVIVFVLVIIVVTNTFQRKQPLSPASRDLLLASTPTPTFPSFEDYITPIAAPPVAPEEKWVTYSNPDLGITLKHPPDWFFNEYTRPDGLEPDVVLSTPVNNPSLQNWLSGQLAAGMIMRHKLGKNETFDYYVQVAKPQDDPSTNTTFQESPWSVGTNEGLGFETISNRPSVDVFFEKNGFVYRFCFGTTYQSAEANYNIYRPIFRIILSSVTFFLALPPG